MDGFLLLNKPSGITSNDLCQIIKKKLKLSKVGHTGTLDPFASGLMILCINKATKLAYQFDNLDKKYEGTILFTKHFDTYDITGNLLCEKAFNKSYDEILEKIAYYNKTYMQKPPMYSAIKVNGKKLYELARKNETIDVKRREVSIFEFKAISPLINDELSFFAHVSKGTYIRSLIVDLANSLNELATLKSLNRTAIGPYMLNQAKTIENVSLADIISLDEYFIETQKLVLNDYMVNLVKNGVILDSRQIITTKGFVVIDKDNEMIAYYEPIGDKEYKPIIIF